MSEGEQGEDQMDDNRLAEITRNGKANTWAPKRWRESWTSTSTGEQAHCG
jgi:hypothetical protein